jgi:hypothetical protein
MRKQNTSENLTNLCGSMAEEAIRLRRRAQDFSPGPERQRLLRLAQRVEVGSTMLEWANSAGLQPPN